MRKLLFSLTVVASVVVMIAQPSWAGDTHFKVFGGMSYISPLSEDDADFGAVRDSVKLSNELGWTVGFEFRFTDWMGLELDYVNATHDIRFDGEKVAKIDFSPVSATFNFHVVHTKIVDLYVGPTASYVYWGDIEFENGLPVGISNQNADNEWAYGASVGLDIGLTDHFAVFGGIRWLKVDIKADDLSTEVGVDPLLSRVGVAFRF